LTSVIHTGLSSFWALFILQNAERKTLVENECFSSKLNSTQTH